MICIGIFLSKPIDFSVTLAFANISFALFISKFLSSLAIVESNSSGFESLIQP